MTSSGRLGTMTALSVAILLFGIASPCHAQATQSSPPVDEYLIASTVPSPAVTPDTVAAGEPGTAAAADSSPSGSPQVGLPPEDTGWHVAVSPYLWFPGVHGTIGSFGRDVSVHATPGDLLSNFRFGLQGLVDTRYKRIVLPVDMFWVRLGDDKALPFPNLMVEKAKLRGSEFILTPKVGFRVVDQEKFKIDALVGFRYWHFGENLKFVPTNLNLNFSDSQDWVDPLVGGRVLVNLSPKISVAIGGDVGGWNTGSLLDYQVAGVLGYKIKPKWTLQAGYRYLSVDYRNSNRGGSIIYLITSGVLFGATMTLK